MRALLAPILVISTSAHAQPEPAEPASAPPVDPVAACKAQRHDLAEKAQHVEDLVERARLLRSLPDCGPLAGSDNPPAPPIAEAPPAAVASGFAIEIHLETAQVVLGVNSSSLPSTSTQPGIFVGYRGAGVTVGVGLELTRFGQASSTGGMSIGSSETSLLIMPGIRVALAGDRHVELLGALDVGYGGSWESVDQGTAAPSVHHLRVQAGPGLRYWMTPAFALGATAGLRYDRLSQSSGPGADRSSTNLALFSSLQLTGVF